MPTRARDVDEVKVQRRIDGDHTIQLNIAERQEAVRILHGRGLNDQEIANAVGHTDRMVLRIRQRLHLAAVVDSGRNQVISQ